MIRYSFFLLVSLVCLQFSASSQGTYKVDLQASKLTWTGYHLAKSYEHTGGINLKSGTVELKDSMPVGGKFVIDMSTISCTDLEDKEENKKLVSHLKSEDFFHAGEYPEASLEITGSKKAEEAYSLSGILTIRGIAKEVTFESTSFDVVDDMVRAKASVRVDRTQFKVMYGWKIANAIIGNEFLLEIDLVARAK